jgi:hypothetical protein
MPPVDMSPKAVTARLKLASELRDLCLLLGKATIEKRESAKKQLENTPVRKNSK